MPPIDTLNLPNFRIFNGMLPMQLPKAAILELDFRNAVGGSNGQPIEINLLKMADEARLEFVQAVFIDNSVSGQAFALRCNQSRQVLKIASGKQAYLPFIVPDPKAILTATAGAATDGLVTVLLLNMPVPAIVW